jgi:hypothetical protein
MIAELEKLARAATGGPWAFNHAGSGRGGVLVYDEVFVYSPAFGVEGVAIAADIADPLTGKMCAKNAAYIAAANPTTMLKLIAAVRAAQAALHAFSNDNPLLRHDCETALRQALAEVQQ